jgi:hypothetical protein
MVEAYFIIGDHRDALFDIAAAARIIAVAPI